MQIDARSRKASSAIGRWPADFGVHGCLRTRPHPPGASRRRVRARWPTAQALIGVVPIKKRPERLSSGRLGRAALPQNCQTTIRILGRGQNGKVTFVITRCPSSNRRGRRRVTGGFRRPMALTRCPRLRSATPGRMRMDNRLLPSGLSDIQPTSQRLLRLPALAGVGGDPDFMVCGGEFAMLRVGEFEGNDVSDKD